MNEKKTINGESAAILVCLSLTLFVALLGNSALLSLIFNKSSSRSGINLLLSSISAADLLFAIAFCPPGIAALTTASFPAGVACEILAGAADAAALAATYGLTALSVCRYLTLARSWDGLTPRRAKMAVVGAWAVALLLALPPSIGWGRHRRCVEVSHAGGLSIQPLDNNNDNATESDAAIVVGRFPDAANSGGGGGSGGEKNNEEMNETGNNLTSFSTPRPHPARDENFPSANRLSFAVFRIIFAFCFPFAIMSVSFCAICRRLKSSSSRVFPSAFPRGSVSSGASCAVALRQPGCREANAESMRRSKKQPCNGDSDKGPFDPSNASTFPLATLSETVAAENVAYYDYLRVYSRVKYEASPLCPERCCLLFGGRDSGDRSDDFDPIGGDWDRRLSSSLPRLTKEHRRESALTRINSRTKNFATILILFLVHACCSAPEMAATVAAATSAAAAPLAWFQVLAAAKAAFFPVVYYARIKKFRDWCQRRCGRGGGRGSRGRGRGAGIGEGGGRGGDSGRTRNVSSIEDFSPRRRDRTGGVHLFGRSRKKLDKSDVYRTAMKVT